MLTSSACVDQTLKPSGDEYLEEIQAALDYYSSTKEESLVDLEEWNIQTQGYLVEELEPYTDFSVFKSKGESNNSKYAPFEEVGMRLDMGQKEWMYMYTHEEMEHGNGTSIQVVYKTPYDDLRTYEVETTTSTYEDNKCINIVSESGTIALNDWDTVTYDDIASLKESSIAINRFLESFLLNFKLDLRKYNFYNMPALLSNELSTSYFSELSEFDATKEIREYYSKIQLGAKGLRYYYYLEAETIPGLAEFGKFDVNRDEDTSHDNVIIEASEISHCYKMTTSSGHLIKYLYIRNDGIAYVYDLDIGEPAHVEADIMVFDGASAYMVLGLRERPAK